MNDVDKKEIRREKRATKKIAKARSKNPSKLAKAEKKFGYDYESAIGAGISPDETGHWPSRNPETGQILKGKKHPTIHKTKKAEKELGYKIKKKKGVLYSNQPVKKVKKSDVKKKK